MSQAAKKILHIITKSNFGGAQRYVLDLAKNTQKQGWITAVACGGKDELVSRLQEEKIPTYEIAGFQRDISVKKEFESFFSIWKITKEFKPDIVHLNSSKAGFLGSLTIRLCRPKTKIIFTVHGWPFLEPRKPAWKFITWLASFFTVILVNRVIFVSKYDLDHSKMPFLKKKAEVIPVAIPPFPVLDREEARKKLLSEEIINQHESHTWLVTIGELNKNKNHEAILDALADLNLSSNNKIFYSLLGAGDELDNLKDQVERRGLKDYVHFFGHVKDARVFLPAFDIFILTSKKEGLPYSILEAGRVGLPVIANSVGGIPEIITHEKSGILIKNADHKSIIKALETLMNEPDKRFNLSEALFKKVENDFSLEKMLKATNHLYQKEI